MNRPVAAQTPPPGSDPGGLTAPKTDVSALSYESARDELVGIVARLEGGQVALEESMRLWERGEALADHCAAWLDGAERRLRKEDAPAGTSESAQVERGSYSGDDVAEDGIDDDGADGDAPLDA